MRILGLGFISVGMVLMIMATYRYYHFLKYNAKETYAKAPVKQTTQKVSMALMFVFIAGFVVGFVDVARRPVEPIFLFVVVIFLFGAVFIFAAVKAQQEMAVQLRNKTMETMKTFVNAIELKDSYTRGHSWHVYQIVKVFYQHMDERLKSKLSEPKLLDAALLHDIGKISIGDDVLNKSGRLNDVDWQQIRQHPMNGKKMLDDTCFTEISDWVLYHHERMDGEGYYGLKGQEIPLEARIITIADTYSALCTDRIYRKMQTHKQAIEIMKDSTGKQLDADLMQVFLQIPRHKLEAVGSFGPDMEEVIAS